MKLPKTTQRHCPYCNKHTEQTVGQAKKRGRSQTHPMSRGSTGRMEARGLRRGYGNHGKYSRPPIASFKMTGKKLSKKTDLRYSCKTCKKQAVQASGIRTKKVEFV
jgi:large subunit ribosomal protein L44e